ncbi:hypothetical protein P261_01972 [Lachnospiraceae bacterium TWA4]|nr:hypothetical protein P261_01972 [Lachnospiraceae bacterium TWA4]
MEEEKVLCVANSYLQKYYLNPRFASLPTQVQDELKAMCVIYVEDVGGVLDLRFNDDNELEFEVSHEDSDYLFDEIGSVLKIKQLQQTKQELLESLELYYRVVILGEEFNV